MIAAASFLEIKAQGFDYAGGPGMSVHTTNGEINDRCRHFSQYLGHCLYAVHVLGQLLNPLLSVTPLLLESPYFLAQLLNLEALGFNALDPKTGGCAGKNGLNLIVLQNNSSPPFS